MKVTANQIRAGRALLNWSQDDLARASDVTRLTIINIESKKREPGAKTLQKIIQAFDHNDIEFTEDEGVRRKNNAVKIFKGTQKGYKFFDFVLNHMRQYYGSLYISNVNSEDYERCFPGLYDSPYYTGLKAIDHQLDVRRLRFMWDRHYTKVAYGRWKFLPQTEPVTAVTFCVFGDYVGILMLMMDEPIIFLINNKKCADTYREKFLDQWERSINPKSLGGAVA